METGIWESELLNVSERKEEERKEGRQCSFTGEKRNGDKENDL